MVDGEPTVSLSRAWAAACVAMVGTFMAIMDVFVVLIAAPAMQHDLHATDAEIQFVLAGYQLTYAVTLVIGGRLGDLYGRKRIFRLGLAVFTVASLACGLVSDADLLIAARLIQGLGAALLFPQVFSIIRVLVPQQHRHRVFGVLGAVIGLSTIAGQVLGGVLIDADLFGTSWRPVFWINVPIGLVTLVLAARLIPESRASQVRRLDLTGAGVLTVALSLLVVPLVAGRQAGWPAWSWYCLVGAAIVFAVFVVVERRIGRHGGAPLVEPALFGERPFITGVSLVLVYYSGLNSFFLILSLTLQDGLGLSPLDAGLVYAPQALMFLLSSLLAGHVAPRSGRRLLLIGGLVTTVGFASTVVVALISGSHLSARLILPTLLVQGIGEGLLQTPLLNSILSRVRSDHIGLASGVLSTAQQVGGALGVAAVGVLFFGSIGSTKAGAASTYAHSFGITTIYHTIAALAVSALVLTLPRRGRPAEMP